MMNKKNFYNFIRTQLYQRGLQEKEVAGFELILAEGMHRRVMLEQLAYILATVFHETNRTMQPVEEANWVGNAKEWRKNNLRYYPYYGRGYVQLTWEANYRKMGKLIGVNLVDNPNRAMSTDIALDLLFEGMLKGYYNKSQKGLSSYINKGAVDYYQARRTVNILDAAGKIKGYAEVLSEALKVSRYRPLSETQEKAKQGYRVQSPHSDATSSPEAPGGRETPSGDFWSWLFNILFKRKKN